VLGLADGIVLDRDPRPVGLMVAKVLALARSFTRVAAYRLGTDERVDWADTRNLPTLDPERAPRLMAVTAKAAPNLKRLAGGSMGGRKLEKPVLHYSLYWPHDRRPAQAEMEQAVAESLAALELERHEALIVAHTAHLHVIANRVHPETGRAAPLGLSRIRLSEWAERWEREHGGIRCCQRVKNNAHRRSRLPG
ncbi:MAG: relaxase/mobilization nuclease domain-containing protein, partial [Acidobacteriota bacterium]|nr:relaxase/mobilization nuclease domain-containing protein [Acidobacteriota bacterium]